MQVGTLAIQHLFEKDVLYRVPLYQRPYVWSQDEQWQPFWNDLRRLAELVQTGQPLRAHFLGASVQDQPSVPPGHIETRLLIDGQQRLTTVQLFLKAFQDVVHDNDDQRYYQALAKLIHNNHPLSQEQFERFKVWPTNADREDFQAVMESENRVALLKHHGKRADARSTGRNIPDAYIFFHDAVAEWLSEAGEAEKDERIAALYSAVRDNVRMVVIDLDEKDDAQLIYETLNARGTSLLAADLVKNSLLSEIENAGGDTETAYQKYWQHFDADSSFWRAEVGRGHAKRARIELFLQHALTMLSGREVSAAHLYTAYRDFSVGDRAIPPMARLEAFKRFGLIYRDLQKGHVNPRIQLFLQRLGTMDVGTAYPLLLKLFDLLGDQEDRLIEVLEDLESFLIRRMVCRLSTRGYNRLFVDLLHALDVGPEDIPGSVRTALLKGKAEFDRWPDDAEYLKAWIENPLYENLTRPRLRLLLEGLEGALRSKFSESYDVPKYLTVEHIMPQSWEMFWPLPEGDNETEAIHRRNQLIHTIGNLTLLNDKLNPAQSNRPWVTGNDPEDGKREALKQHSVLFLNKQLCESESWSEETILDRSTTLFDVVLQIWPRPAQV